jgi:hypothetical protein
MVSVQRNVAALDFFTLGRPCAVLLVRVGDGLDAAARPRNIDDRPGNSLCGARAAGNIGEHTVARLLPFKDESANHLHGDLEQQRHQSDQGDFP